MLTEELRAHLLAGHVIPAHPLALTERLAIDEKHQRALTRYYVASGAGGIAVGVHTTGFPIHDPKIGLYEPVLQLAQETATRALSADVNSPKGHRPFVRVAGLIGKTDQALREAAIARKHRYDCGLLSLGAWRDATASEILAHCHHVAEAIPLFGFYLQPAVGGRVLNYAFWREFCDIPDVVAIKVAPFNRYATLEVVRALADSGRTDIALYTGNDDAIVNDLVTDVSASSTNVGAPHLKAPQLNTAPLNAPYFGAPHFGAPDFGAPHFVGGLLGQWAVWTRSAVTLLADIHAWRASGSDTVPRTLLRYGSDLTEANAAVFDVANNFAGCIPGILEVLRVQGLVRNTLTFDEGERLSPGQAERIAEVRARFPALTDDAFVAEHLDSWLA